jgi:hypothetical protein
MSDASNEKGPITKDVPFIRVITQLPDGQVFYFKGTLWSSRMASWSR